METKHRVASALGCSLEWFDFSLYGYFSIILAQAFFPPQMDTLTSLINTLGIFAVGFLARPLGGIFFGRMTDHVGRTRTLKSTPLLLSLFTASIGLIPSYSSIGYFSVLLLFIIRFFQGICIGGEYGTNIIYLVESSKKHAYFWGGIGSATGCMGIVLASLLSAVFLHFSPSAHSGVWRFAFLSALPIGFFIYILRRSIPENYKPLPKTENQSVLKELCAEWKNIVTVTGLLCLHASSFYFVFLFIPNYLITFRHMAAASAMSNNAIFLIIQMSFIPLFGYLADRFGGLKIALINTALFAVLSFCLFYEVTVGSLHQIYAWIVGFCILISGNAGALPALILNPIPMNKRGIVYSTAFNTSFAIFGGLTPWICLSFAKYVSVTSLLPGYYLTGMAVITLTVLIIRSNRVLKGGYGNAKCAVSKSTG